MKRSNLSYLSMGPSHPKCSFKGYKSRSRSVLFWVLASLVSICLTLACDTFTPPTPTSSSVNKPSDNGLSNQVVRTQFSSVTILPELQVETKIAYVETLPKELTVIAGRQVSLVARAYDSTGSLIPNATFKWIAVNSLVGTVTTDGQIIASEISGNYPEAIRVTAILTSGQTIQTKTTKMGISIVPRTKDAILAYVQVAPKRIIVRQNQIFRIGAIAYDSEGIPVPRAQLSWKLADSRLGHLNSIGYLTVQGPPGTYNDAVHLRAKLGTSEVETKATVEVVSSKGSQNLERVYVVPSQLTIASQGQFQFFAIALNQNGEIVPDSHFTWRMRDARAGVVDQDGNFSASKAEGVYPDSLEVTASIPGDSGSATQKLSITITAPKKLSIPLLAQVRLRPENPTLRDGSRMMFSAQGFSANGLPIPNLSFSWSVVTPEIGTITEFGSFRVHAPPGRHSGAIRVHVTQTNQGKTITHEARTDILVAGHLESVTLEPTEATIGVNGSAAFHAQGVDSTGLPIPGLLYRWKVLDPRAGSIDQLGNFFAGSEPGVYSQAIQVTVIEPGRKDSPKGVETSGLPMLNDQVGRREENLAMTLRQIRQVGKLPHSETLCF